MDRHGKQKRQINEKKNIPYTEDYTSLNEPTSVYFYNKNKLIGLLTLNLISKICTGLEAVAAASAYIESNMLDIVNVCNFSIEIKTATAATTIKWNKNNFSCLC